uniref:Guanine nucleotide-binding protein subunit gamma n=1 Tax=Steinernema glaseri TaxID=37863 RepID=A0A1I7ZFM6_9BILA
MSVQPNEYWDHPLNSTVSFAQQLVKESKGELRIVCYNNVILLELARKYNYEEFDHSYPEQLEFVEEASFKQGSKRRRTCCTIL